MSLLAPVETPCTMIDEVVGSLLEEAGVAAATSLLHFARAHEHDYEALDWEHDNLLGALAWSRGNAQTSVITGICSALTSYWDTRGLWRLAVEWFREGQNAASSNPRVWAS